ncbi:CatB-related O-acetyltransferase [Aeromonas media]|uniref:CatB-related O-acetyltransferase n=1 Tax=Aeromonas media TaxID=651 RepID=UPI003D19468D
MINIEYKKIKSTFEQFKIYSTTTGVDRFNSNSVISLPDKFKIYEHSAFLYGYQLCSMGFMSYSWSPLVDYLEIGNYCSIASGLKFSGVRHPIEAVTTSPIMYDRVFALVNSYSDEFQFNPPKFYNRQPKRNIKIGNDVWIGSNVWLARGIEIGNGSIIAAESVVTKDVAPYTIVGGNPAKKIRDRFSKEIAERLNNSNWWNMSPRKLGQLSLDDPIKFIAQIEMQEFEEVKLKYITENDIV